LLTKLITQTQPQDWWLITTLWTEKTRQNVFVILLQNATDSD